MNDDLYTLITQSKNKNKDSTLKIVDTFMPLIKKYTRKLNYDGADTDLTISLINLIKKMPTDENELLQKDKVIVSYISISIKNEYIRLSQKHSKVSKTEILYEDDILNALQCYNENYDFIIEDLLSDLSELQKKVIKSIFLMDIKEIDLAKSLNISRQAVNKTKNIALKKLKNNLV